jgi:hypothetical protein
MMIMRWVRMTSTTRSPPNLARSYVQVTGSNRLLTLVEAILDESALSNVILLAVCVNRRTVDPGTSCSG